MPLLLDHHCHMHCASIIFQSWAFHKTPGSVYTFEVVSFDNIKFWFKTALLYITLCPNSESMSTVNSKPINDPFMPHCILWWPINCCPRSKSRCWISSDGNVSLTPVFANSCRSTGVLENVSVNPLLLKHLVSVPPSCLSHKQEVWNVFDA